MKLDFSLAKDTEIGRFVNGCADDYEPEVLNLLFSFIDSHKSSSKKLLFIDVGSNIGYFPIRLAHYAKSKNVSIEIYAHEPLPFLREISTQLMSSNGIVYNLSEKALSDFQGVDKFYVSSKSDASNSLNPNFRKHKEVIDVQISTLDCEYARLVAGDYVASLLMIDVETMEPNVLRGGANFIKKFRPLIVCEVLNDRTESELMGIFTALDYKWLKYDGKSWVESDVVVGDKNYIYRDWLFAPREKNLS